MKTVSFEFISREEHNAFERNLVLGPSTETGCMNVDGYLPPNSKFATNKLNSFN